MMRTWRVPDPLRRGLHGGRREPVRSARRHPTPSSWVLSRSPAEAPVSASRGRAPQGNSCSQSHHCDPALGTWGVRVRRPWPLPGENGAPAVPSASWGGPFTEPESGGCPGEGRVAGSSHPVPSEPLGSPGVQPNWPEYQGRLGLRGASPSRQGGRAKGRPASQIQPPNQKGAW